MNLLKAKKWWPVMAGVSFALVEILSFLISKTPLGASRAYVETASIITSVFFKDHAAVVEYYTQYQPQISWTAVLLAGVVTGSFISSRLSGDFHLRSVPTLWKSFFGQSRAKRLFWTFVGGFLVALGGRLGQGCISGQVIAGVTQLGVGAFVFLQAIVTGGILTAIVFYRFNVFKKNHRQPVLYDPFFQPANKP